MTAKILDGVAVAKKIKSQLAKQILQRKQQNLPTPGLSVILVGNDPSSAIYVQHKQKDCEDVGIKSFLHHLPDTVSEEEIEKLIRLCNEDPKIHGILLQLPLPMHINANNLLEAIHPNKDVDGFHPYNLGRLSQRRPRLRCCTPKGVMTLLHETDEDLTGKHAVIIGASNHVGRPMALELLLEKCTVTICHRFTRDLQKHVNEADILIAAIGKPGIVKTAWIKPSSIVIDVGFTRLANGQISGDIDFNSAKEIASWITPVPGGIGPMTRASLLENTLMAVELSEGKKVES